MKIVSDRGFDLSPEQMEDLEIHMVPLLITLDGVTYRSGVDIQPQEFYEKLEDTESFPTTSQPSAGDFAELYRKLAQTDPDILSVHISSGLSGTIQAARVGASMVPEANVTIVDTKTLSCPMGWQVEAAARAIQAGWSKDQIISMLSSICAATEGMFTLNTLKYLIHGGRISHMKGLLASLLHIKPIIGVEKERGTYVNHAQERTLKRALTRMAEMAANWNPGSGALKVQLLHGNNMEGVEYLKQQLSALADCTFLPVASIAPVLGAHTGPGLVGLAFAPISLLPEIPGKR